MWSTLLYILTCSTWWEFSSFNTQNMTNQTIVSPFKMEYGWNFSIPEKWSRGFFLKFFHSLIIFYQMNLSHRKEDFYQKYKSRWHSEHMEEFQKYFFQTTFQHHFRLKMITFHPYFILTGDTIVGFVICCELLILNLMIWNFRLQMNRNSSYNIWAF